MTTLHLVGLPHTETTARYLICAFTQKLLKFCQMMHGRARRIVLYAGQRNEAPCDEFVPLISDAEREGWFGPWAPANPFTNLTWDAQHPAWQTMNGRAIAAIRARAEPHDLVLLLAGTAQQPIAAAFPSMLVAEWAVGYEGIFSNFCCFESFAWMHYLYGKRGLDGRFYDQVIPNFFDAHAFHPTRHNRFDYLLFIGRLTQRKGPHVAAQIAAAAGRRLLVAGPGATAVTKRAGGGCRIEGDHVVIEGDHVEYIGPVDAVHRARLMAEATAVLVPTLYVEPFGGVAVEAMLSGTPVITTDWGAFTETVDHGVTGFRFRTLADGVRAVRDCETLSPRKIRGAAIARFSLEAVAPRFDAWLTQLDGLWGEGWPALPRQG